MRIVDPSTEIVPKQGHFEQIARFGATAYQTKEVKGGPLAFFKRMRDIGHHPVLEGSVITIEVQFSGSTVSMEEFLATDREYLNVTVEPCRMVTVTANIRAWREWILANRSEFGGLISSIEDALSEGEIFMLFDDILVSSLPDDNLHVRVVSREEVEGFSQEKRDKHLFVMVEFTANRAVSHELVRHRPCSFLQESQRYCRYSDEKFGNEVTFIRPSAFLPIAAIPCSICEDQACESPGQTWCYIDNSTNEETEQYKLWADAMLFLEKQYFLMLKENASPQLARLVLPNSCKTVLMVYANLEEWKHIFSLRTTKAADPSMREVMIPLQEKFESRLWL